MEPQDGGTTEMGLPRRVRWPSSFPAAWRRPTGGSDRRTPDAVRGLLSAYHRGVQRGRGAPRHGRGARSTDPQTSGKEQEA